MDNKCINTIAMYLPQFHRVKENDEWWGEGFTEWNAVKAAEPLFSGHNQPRVPLDENYYDLMNKNTMKWQADIAREYGVDGFCFYHYYFKNKRKILEKPAENLLKLKDIKINYCMCWANETWARTWTNISGANSWSERFEPKDKKGDGILLEQDYGDAMDWEEHFNYLLQFFKDDRYIKVENKPMFLIYKPEDIQDIDKMMGLWNKLAKKNGFEGIYIIAVNTVRKIGGVDAILLHGPVAYYSALIAGMKVEPEFPNGICSIEYNKCYENAIRHNIEFGQRIYYGGFVDYDDTPRRGKLGKYMKNADPNSFFENMFKLAKKNIQLGNKYLFINAWNEWGEGNYLEPDEKNGYKYLQELKCIVDKCNEKYDDIISEGKMALKEGNIENDKGLIQDLNKYRELYTLLNRWMLLKEAKKTVCTFFEKYEYTRIMIYGMAALGQHLYNDIQQDQKLKVIGGIDRRQGIDFEDVKLYTLEEQLPECDVIVVAVALDFAEIKNNLKNKTNAKIVSLREILFDKALM